MLRNAEKIEDDVRERIQQAKDDIWDEFKGQIKDINTKLDTLVAKSGEKDDQIQDLYAKIEKERNDNAKLRREMLEIHALVDKLNRKPSE